MIGCDVHPSYRRKGIATYAYEYMFKELSRRMWREVRLKVLKHNKVAIDLYRKLGFSEISEDDESLLFSKIINNGIKNKSVKVVACYCGDRRREPLTAKETHHMYKYLWLKESSIDYGDDMDILFVHNKAFLRGDHYNCDVVTNIEEYHECANFLLSLDGKKTNNGKCLVLERENIGLSFGAYDWAFDRFKEDYDFWFFTEDDVMCIKDNVLSCSIEKIMDISNIGKMPLGFVASVGIDKRYNSAHGGCGVASQRSLMDLYNNNYSRKLKRGALPFFNTSKRGYCSGKHEIWGEVSFTNKSLKLGYNLGENNIKSSVLRYGYTGKILNRMFKKYNPDKIKKEMNGGR